LPTTNVVAFAPAMATPFFIHWRDTDAEAATLDVSVTDAVAAHNVVFPVVDMTGLAGAVPVVTQEQDVVLNEVLSQH